MNDPVDKTSAADRQTLRRLAGEIAEIASLDRHAETAELWRRMNDLDPVRPMVRIYQIPWREMDVDGELTCTTEGAWARAMETEFRRTLYLWRHMPADMVVEGVYRVPMAIASTGQGMHTHLDAIPHDERGGVTAKFYHSQIATEEDIEKIQMPSVTCDGEATEARRAWAAEVLDGLLDVKVVGKVAHNYAPWDRLAEWCNPQQVLMDLITRPAFVHKLMDRLTTSYCRELDQLAEQNLLSLDTGNYGVGQGGFGFTGDLPQADCDGDRVRLIDQWGGAMAQIFSEVSPAMHEEFALQYENRYLRRFGMTYYGCCEPLDRKVDVIARNIPNLRKLSMSPWVDPARGAEAIAGRFVFSFKPNPAFLAPDDRWDADSARDELQTVLEVNRGVGCELILKDISTVRFQPQRLWEWETLASRLARDSA